LFNIEKKFNQKINNFEKLKFYFIFSIFLPKILLLLHSGNGEIYFIASLLGPSRCLMSALRWRAEVPDGDHTLEGDEDEAEVEVDR
jgi:hypothetical protein